VRYTPEGAKEYRTTVILLTPNTGTQMLGVSRANGYTESGVIFCDWKSYGGTEQTVNGVYSILDTANVTTWYRPDITAACRVKREDGAVYEIINEPENIEMQNRVMQFKVRRVKGGA
jgi:head-tail adaptor